ncbi:hypothetical protein L6452_33867 [Arctium lappa]|uniref:Uncharacterized protein n=1 Tax=Arctium lappa TaxID=4217 RepID=A0ACB8YGS4_ARCLA|nr:hypothetical protein L6452_33867 [Arctium lappa]
MSPAPRRCRKQMSTREMLPPDSDLERRTASQHGSLKVEWGLVAAKEGSGRLWRAEEVAAVVQVVTDLEYYD